MSLNNTLPLTKLQLLNVSFYPETPGPRWLQRETVEESRLGTEAYKTLDAKAGAGAHSSLL